MTTISKTDLNKQALQERYDAHYVGDYMDADAYSTWVHEGLAAQRVRQTLQEIPITPTRLLDYGCGQGKWSALLRSLYPRAEISGIDISAVAIEKASRKYPDCRFAAFDGGRAPFEDSSFDLVFSFHVLEHVLDIDASVSDIARLVRPGGWACIIFPCGNKGSFEERFVSLLKNGRELSPTGEPIFFFEKGEGHLRRMESSKSIALFSARGLRLQREFYSGQRFAALDWLIRGTGPSYINGLFRGVTPNGTLAAVKMKLMHRMLLGLNRFLGFKGLDMTRRRPAAKQVAARALRIAATGVDGGLMKLARREWERKRSNKSGSVQYLVFQRPVEG